MFELITCTRTTTSNISVTDAMLLPLANGEVSLLYDTGDPSTLSVTTYDGAGWSTPLSTSTSYNLLYSSAVAVGDNIYVGAVDANWNIAFLSFIFGTGSGTGWQSPVQIGTSGIQDATYAAISNRWFAKFCRLLRMGWQ